MTSLAIAANVARPSRGTASERMKCIERVFYLIATTRMAGIPVLNRRLLVEAIGFEPLPDAPDQAGGEIGILITPWFMNLIWLPLCNEAEVSPLPVGQSVVRELGVHTFEFIGAWEAELGSYQFCSLFSPMFEFADQDSARATAMEVLRLLLGGASAYSASSPAEAAQMNRRGFLFGRLQSTWGGS